MGKLLKILRIALLFFILVGVSNQALQGQFVSKTGSNAAAFLKIPVGARATGLGGAVVATVDGPSALYWNPAAITGVKEISISAEYSDWLLDLDHTFFGVVFPTKKYGSIGLSAVALTMDEFEERTLEFPEGTGRTFNAFSVAAGLTYAYELFPNFSLGGTFKFVNESIDDATASNAAFDIGTTYVTPFDDIKFGVSITNAGGKLQISGDNLIILSDPNPSVLGNNDEIDALLKTDKFNLPLQLQAGLAWDAYKQEGFRATIMLDGNVPRDNEQNISIGTEIALLDEVLFIRGGVPNLGMEDRPYKFAAGGGLKYHLTSAGIGFNIGYSYTQHEFFSGINRISASFSFTSNDKSQQQ